MDEEEKGLDLPENGESLDDAQAKNADLSGDMAGMTPEEREMMAMAGETPESLLANDSHDSAADKRNGQMLSEEDINKALGDMAGDLDKSGLPDAGDFGFDRVEVKQADFQQLSASPEADGPRNINLLMDVELPVSIELGKTRMRISDILALGPGSIVELDKLVGEPVDLLVNQKCVARGEVVVVEESFGLRITMLVSPEERLKNLQ